MNHSFNVYVATKYGIPCALLLEHIDFHVRANASNKAKAMEHDGKYWMFKSYEKFAETYPYFTENQIRRAIETLRREGLIMSRCSGRAPWYTVTKKGRKLLSGRNEVPADMPYMVGNSATQGGTDANQTGKFAIPSIDIIENIVEPIVEEVVEEIGGGGIEIEGNPFAASSAHFEPDPLVIYASNNLTAMSGDNMDELISFRDALPDELIRHAINAACGAGVRTYKYVKSILNRYVEQGFKTIGDVEAYEQERKSRNGGNAHGGNGSRGGAGGNGEQPLQFGTVL